MERKILPRRQRALDPSTYKPKSQIDWEAWMNAPRIEEPERVTTARQTRGTEMNPGFYERPVSPPPQPPPQPFRPPSPRSLRVELPMLRSLQVAPSFRPPPPFSSASFPR
jgi:hypothetical protein